MLVGYIGQAFLYVIAIVLMITSIVRHKMNHLLLVQSILFIMTFGLLVFAHISCNFNLLTVLEHTHTNMPLIYKIGAVWSSHEGSMLLWIMLLSLCPLFVKDVNAQRILVFILFGFTVFMIIACDPFIVVLDPIINGQDLNPVLQDHSLLIHPPILYAGFVSLSIPFVLSISSLIRQDFSKEWFYEMRQSTRISWSLITIGLGLGSFWAYYELGWGGYWFWDPVENIALLPWLISLALLHVLSREKAMLRSVHALAIGGFSVCILGMVAVRSGVLTSIHSFAVDTDRGLLLSVLWLIITLPPLVLLLKTKITFETKSANILLIRLQSILLLIITIFIFIGTFYPVMMNWLGHAITIDNHYFEVIVHPLMVLLVACMAFAPMINKPLKDPLLLTAFCAGILGAIMYHTLSLRPLMIGYLGIFSAIWMIVIHLQNIKNISMHLAHIGVGLLVLGILLSAANQKEFVKTLSVNQTTQIGNNAIMLKNITRVTGTTFNSLQAHIIVDGSVYLVPERRYFWTQELIHDETSIHSSALSHIYANIRDINSTTAIISITFKPFINLIWLGIVLMTVGGITAFCYRAKKNLNTYPQTVTNT